MREGRRGERGRETEREREREREKSFSFAAQLEILYAMPSVLLYTSYGQ